LETGQRAAQARWCVSAFIIFLLEWALKNREEAFYSALRTKWPILRKTMDKANKMIWKNPVSSAALSQIRQQVGSEPFDKLLISGTNKHMDRHSHIIRLKGYCLYAIDGSSLNLPSTQELDNTFGRPSSNGKNSALPQASFTALIFINTGWTTNYILGDCNASELCQTKILTSTLGAGDLIVADRLNFDTEWFRDLSKRSVKFLFKATKSRFKSFSAESIEQIMEMRKKGVVDCNVDLKIKGSLSHLIQIRYLEIPRKGEETLCFVTNLHQDEFSLEEIVILYKLRWEVETGFRYFKGEDHKPVILSRKEVTVRQEVAARVIAYNTVRYTQSEACLKEESVVPCAADSQPYPEKNKQILSRKISPDKWTSKCLLWETMPLRPVDLQFNSAISLITSFLINEAIYPVPDNRSWNYLLDEIAKEKIKAKDGRQFERKGRKYNKGKKQKGNRKKQYQRRKLREKKIASGET
jgi:hypothetical protein